MQLRGMRNNLLGQGLTEKEHRNERIKMRMILWEVIKLKVMWMMELRLSISQESLSTTVRMWKARVVKEERGKPWQ